MGEIAMAKKLVIIGLMLLFASPLARAEAADLDQAGILTSDKHEMQDRSKENACDCCQKCMAAKSSIKSKGDGGPAETNGCKDCCQRCGKVLQPSPEEIPPEVIEKQIPPEIRDNQKR
jgi:hypothetical protein